MSSSFEPPFERTELLDKPGIVGAKWWQEGLATHDPIARRQALVAIGVLGVILVGVGGIVAAAVASSEPDTTTTLLGALDMQRKYGWSFGAAGEALTFNGQSLLPFDPASLDRMSSDLSPAQARLRPFSSPTLFQSPRAQPTETLPEDPTPTLPLRSALRPIITPAMDAAYRAGRSLGTLFAPLRIDAAIVVDLPGPEAIAFAAGLADLFDPCFTFENWPHPRGVVDAHLTLGAAAYFQPLFARTMTTRKQAAPPSFVLDRHRLASYTDDVSQFDNRYAAKLPTADALRQLGTKRVLYVVPTASDVVELDDLNEQLISYVASGLEVKAVAVTDFGPDPRSDSIAPAPGQSLDNPLYYYGSAADSHLGFWGRYRWSSAPSPSTRVPANVSRGSTYVPLPRTTAFSSAATPAGFGLVPVVLAAGTGAILGAKLSRSGSWNRASSGS